MTGDGHDLARPRAPRTPGLAPRRPRRLSRASPFPRRGRPAHLSRGISRTRGRGGALASGPAGRGLRRPRSFHPEPRGRAPAPRPGPAGARVRGALRSWGCGGGEGRAERTARLSPGKRRGLGLRLLRKRQPPGRSPAQSFPTASPLKDDRASSRRVLERDTGRELSRQGQGKWVTGA